MRLNSGKYDTVDQKPSFGNDILTTMNFKIRDLDLQAMGRGGDGTGKICRPIPRIRQYMNTI